MKLALGPKAQNWFSGAYNPRLGAWQSQLTLVLLMHWKMPVKRSPPTFEMSWLASQ